MYLNLNCLRGKREFIKVMVVGGYWGLTFMLIITRYEDSMLLCVEDRFIEETLFLDYFLIVFEFILIVGCEGAL
jgi:hypothetical protein